MREFTKDPDAVLDYVIDWTDWLADSETISTAVMTVEAGLSKDSETNTTTSHKVWVSGGTAGSRYRITSRITTNQGRTDDRSAMIRVANR